MNFTQSTMIPDPLGPIRHLLQPPSHPGSKKKVSFGGVLPAGSSYGSKPPIPQTVNTIQALKPGAKLQKLKTKIKGDKTAKKNFSGRLANVLKDGKLCNVYELLPKEYQPDNSNQYPNYKKIKIKLPFQALLVGKTGGGKTNMLCNLLMGIGVFTKIFLCVKNPDEPLYKFLIDKYTALGNKVKEQLIWVYDDPLKLPGPEQFKELLEGQRGLLVIDDMVTEDEKNLQAVKMAFSQGRKWADNKGLSCVFITQGYFDTPNFLRRQSSLIALGPITSMNDFKRIASEYALDKSPEELAHMHREIQDQGTMNFMLIDLTKNSMEEKHLKYRKNFEVKGGPDESSSEEEEEDQKEETQTHISKKHKAV
jgi:hypothetical protein